MGQRGPAPKPTALRLLHGQKPKNPDEPMARVGTPDPPDWIDADVRAVWDRTVDELTHMGVLTTADRDTLVVYCQAVVNHAQAAQLVAKSGTLLRGRDGGVVKNPACQIMRDQALLVRAMAQEFGLTPSARVSITTNRKGSDEHAAERLLS